MIKKITIISLIATLIGLLPQCGKKQETPVSYLNIEITNPTDNPLLIKQGHAVDTIEPDTGKNTVCSLQTDTAVYLQISYRRLKQNVFVKPGDSIRISINGAGKRDGIHILGPKSPENTYLDSLPTLIGKSMVIRDITPSVYRKALDSVSENAIAHYDSLSEKWESTKFRETEKWRIAYQMGYSEMILAYYHLYQYDSLDALVAMDFFQASDSLPDENMLMRYTDSYVNFFNHKIRNYHSDSSAKVDSMKNFRDFYCDYLSKNIHSKEINELLTYTLIMNETRYSGFESYEEKYSSFMENAGSEALKTQLKARKASWDRIASGQPAPGFSYPDSAENTYTLADFWGKPLYIDVWATWCGPCRREIPHLKLLEEEYRDSNIQFISVSVDEHIDAWRRFVVEDEPEWLQLYTGGWDCEICNQYNIHGIPRFILIDKEGKIIDANAPRPSSKLIRPMLDSVLNIVG